MGEHSSDHVMDETTSIGVGDAKITASFPRLRKDVESTLQLTIVREKTQEPISQATVECTVLEGSTPDTHAMNHSQHAAESLDSSKAENIPWQAMVAKGSGIFTFAYTPRQTGQYLIRVRIASIDNRLLDPAIIVEKIRTVSDQAGDKPSRGMMGGMGSFGTFAVAGMAAIMIILMTTRWL